jgi:hypothetical protein
VRNIGPVSRMPPLWRMRASAVTDTSIISTMRTGRRGRTRYRWPATDPCGQVRRSKAPRYCSSLPFEARIDQQEQRRSSASFLLNYLHEREPGVEAPLPDRARRGRPSRGSAAFRGRLVLAIGTSSPL